MNSNVPMTTRNPLVAAIAPSNQAAGAQSTGWISVADYFNFMALVNVGALGASGTVDAKIEQAQDSSGTGAKASPARRSPRSPPTTRPLHSISTRTISM